MDAKNREIERLVHVVDYLIEKGNFLRAHVPDEVAQSDAYREREWRIFRSLGYATADIPGFEPEAMPTQERALEDTMSFVRNLISEARDATKPEGR